MHRANTGTRPVHRGINVSLPLPPSRTLKTAATAANKSIGRSPGTQPSSGAMRRRNRRCNRQRRAGHRTHRTQRSARQYSLETHPFLLLPLFEPLPLPLPLSQPLLILVIFFILLTCSFSSSLSFLFPYPTPTPIPPPFPSPPLLFLLLPSLI